MRQTQAQPITTFKDRLELIDTEKKINQANQKIGDQYIAEANKLLYNGTKDDAKDAIALINKAKSFRPLSREEEEINKNDKEKAIQLVELFSDNVLQIVYEKVKFIEHRSEKSCLVFNCKLDEVELISLNVKEGNSDLSTPQSIHDAMVNRPNEIALFKTSKKYSKNRIEVGPSSSNQ